MAGVYNFSSSSRDARWRPKNFFQARVPALIAFMTCDTNIICTYVCTYVRVYIYIYIYIGIYIYMCVLYLYMYIYYILCGSVRDIMSEKENVGCRRRAFI